MRSVACCVFRSQPEDVSRLAGMLPSDDPLLDSIEIELREQGSWREPGDELWVGSASAGRRWPRLAVVDDLGLALAKKAATPTQASASFPRSRRRLMQQAVHAAAWAQSAIPGSHSGRGSVARGPRPRR